MIITEETLLLQKRAGIITETEYKEKMAEVETAQEDPNIDSAIKGGAESLKKFMEEKEESDDSNDEKGAEKNEKKENTYYRMQIYGNGIENIPCILKRKQAIKRNKNKSWSGIKIKIIRCK